MTDFADWLQELVKRLLDALWDFLSDIVIAILDLLLSAIIGLLSLLPVPFEGTSLQVVFDQLPPEVWFFLGYLQLPACFAVLGTALVFRLSRKVLTLFQW